MTKFSDWFFGRLPPDVLPGVQADAERDDIRFDRKRLDQGLAELTTNADAVVKKSGDLKAALTKLVDDLNDGHEKGKSHAKIPARPRKT